MDPEYSGTRKSLYCSLCAKKIGNPEKAYEHNCFRDMEISNLKIVGNIIITEESFDETVEYLDEDRELFNRGQGADQVDDSSEEYEEGEGEEDALTGNTAIDTDSAFSKIIQGPSCSSISENSRNSLQASKPRSKPVSDASGSNENTFEALRTRLGLSTHNVNNENAVPTPAFSKIIQGPSSSSISENSRNSLQASKPESNKYSVLNTKKKVPAEGAITKATGTGQADSSECNIEVDEEERACCTERNLIALIEMVREKPCIWNYRLPIADRSQQAISDGWTEIASHFPGWSTQELRNKFSTLKTTFVRRNMYPRSGSGSSNKKHWPYDKYFDFLKDTVSPGSTISNVLSPTPKKRTVSKNDDNSLLAEMGFEITSDKEVVPQKKTKSPDNMERMVFAKILNKENRTPRPPPNELDQWALWLSKQLQGFSDPIEILKIQTHITSYITQRKIELKSREDS